MGKHEDDFFQRVTPGVLADAGVTPAVPTQVARPWRATWRTVVQVGIPSFILLLGVLPEVLDEIVAGMGDHLPPGLRAALAGTAVLITALSGTLARIAAIPRVNEALKAVKLSAR
jgi:hypothetical protein